MLLQLLADTATATPQPLPPLLPGMDWVGVGLQVLMALSPVLMGLLGWVATVAARFIAAKTKNEQIRDLLLRLDTLVFKVVTEIEQTTKDALIKASADGVITNAEKAQIKQAAIDAVRSYLGPKGLAELKTLLGLKDDMIGGFLGTVIESAVFSLKSK